MMRIAISMRQVVDPRHGERRDALASDWGSYIASIWPRVTLLPLLNQPDRVDVWADSLAIDGAILSNGNDWGEAPARDETETRLVAWCRRNERPVLGACRGLQAINAMLGGGIHSDISTAGRHTHGGQAHPVQIIDPVFVKVAGGRSMEINSYHDQGVLRSGLAGTLRPFAVAGNDVVEGFYHPAEPILAIQWHPERPSSAQDFSNILIRRIFEDGAFWR